MLLSFRKSQPALIGVVHLAPLPGSPGWDGRPGRLIKKAVTDAKAYEQGGVDALIVENFGDAPFFKSDVPPETIAAMSAAGSAIGQATRLPLGFNVLRNDARGALALCAACGGSFIRVNVHIGAMLTDQGLIEGRAGETLRLRKALCPKALILADVHVKHAVPIGRQAMEDAARDTLERGLADVLILSGSGTGKAANLAEVQRLRSACPRAKIVIGSGITLENTPDYLKFADGFIVGTSLKRGGRVFNPVDSRRVAALSAVVRGGRAGK